MKLQPLLLFFSTIAVYVVIPAWAEAQAYCRLRDPITQIRTLYPESDAHRSIVRTVDMETRETVSESLPFDLHFNELGRHTLYVAQNEMRPLGVVHARTEKGSWGLIEIAWAIDFNMRIVGFEFQRCRSPEKKAVDSDYFRELVSNKTLDELRGLLSEDHTRLAVPRLSWSDAAEKLAVSSIQSAMKTLVVTENVWRDDLPVLSAFSNALPTFSAAVGIVPVNDVYTDRTHEILAEKDLAKTDLGIERSGVVVFRVQDVENAVIGYTVIMPWIYEGTTRQIVWNIDADHRVVNVKSATGWASKEIQTAFELAIGLSPETKAEDCSTFTQLIACEAIVVTSTDAGRG